VEEHDELARYSNSRFSLNSAVVSLVTLFLDTVQRMYRHLDVLIPRQNGRYLAGMESRARSKPSDGSASVVEWDQKMAFIGPFVWRAT
jgi:hypothetical protein